MAIVDLTRRELADSSKLKMITTDVALESGKTRYTGVIYRHDLSSMYGTYIDFPGHIRETDNGVYADNVPFEELYRSEASVIHLDRREGGVDGDELERAFGGKPETAILVINALGRLDETELPGRSVFLTCDALDWIIGCNVRYLISDIYESQELHGVFLKLFQAGITTVCCPADLHKLTEPKVRITCSFLPLPKVTQLACRLIAEF